VLTPSQKGSIAEAAIVAEAVRHGVGVYKPVNEGLRYDLIFDVGTQLVRVQCKWAIRRGDVVIVRCYSCRRTRNGLACRSYTADEIDAIAAYCDELRRCFFFEFGRLPRSSAIQFRLQPTANNQKAGVNWADSFDFAATLHRVQGP
jgi:hypothetical protein